MTVPLPLVQDHQVRLQGSATYLAEDYAVAMAMVGAGAVDPAELVTHVSSLDEVEAAFAAARSGEHIKVLIGL